MFEAESAGGKEKKNLELLLFFSFYGSFRNVEKSGKLTRLSEAQMIRQHFEENVGRKHAMSCHDRSW